MVQRAFVAQQFELGRRGIVGRRRRIGGLVMVLNDDDRRRIADAIATAERATAAEIVVVVAGRSGEYRYLPWFWAGLLALFAPAPLVFLTILANVEIYLIQLVIFVAVLGALSSRRLRVAAATRQTKRDAVQDRAREQFLARGIGVTVGRTGALIFASEAERMVEILVDDGLAARLAPGTLEAAVADITAALGENRPADGFVAAIERLGLAFAPIAPRLAGDVNELPDDVVTL